MEKKFETFFIVLPIILKLLSPVGSSENDQTAIEEAFGL